MEVKFVKTYATSINPNYLYKGTLKVIVPADDAGYLPQCFRANTKRICGGRLDTDWGVLTMRKTGRRGEIDVWANEWAEIDRKLNKLIVRYSTLLLETKKAQDANAKNVASNLLTPRPGVVRVEI